LVVGKHLASARAAAKESSLIGTLDLWLERQEKSWTPKRSERKPTDIWGMPKNTMEEWLEHQKVLERKESTEVTPPIGSTEAWLRHQVSERLVQENAEQVIVT
jgi:hypothetical protein